MDRQGRVLGLDAWRSALLLVGVLLHGSIGLPDSPIFAGVDIVSQTFRMGSFFAIAGALSALAIARRSPREWIRGRLVRLGIPLCFGMATVPPLIWMMTRTWGWAATQPPVLFDWYHLWFLIALSLYSLALFGLFAFRLDSAIEAKVSLWAQTARGTGTIAILTTACASAVLFAIVPPVLDLMLSPRMFMAFRNIQLIVGYLPMFLFGALAMRIPAFGARLLADWRSAATIVAVVTGGYIGWFGLIDPNAPAAEAHDVAIMTAKLRFIAGALCPPAAFVLILRSALSIRRVPVLLVRLSEASYTIYLLHLPLAAAINLPLRASGVDTHLSYVAAVIGSGVASYLFHRGCVRHSDVLKLLLNGRVPRHLPLRRYADERR